MDIASITVQLQVLWRKVPQQALTHGLIVVLASYIAYLCAQFTWALVPEAKVVMPVISSATNVNANSTSTVNTSSLKSLNLFGQYNSKPVVAPKVETIKSAPETKLKLTLAGLVASDDAQIAAAIIESKGQQNTYGIDDRIEGTRTTLKQVLNDRVIIETSGRMETLMLDGFDYTSMAEVPGQQGVVKIPKVVKKPKTNSRFDAERAARLKERVNKARTDILDNPAKITDYIKISPKRRNGKVYGYQLMPSKDPEFFEGVGLIPGDVAIQINGKDLTDMREAQQAMIELKSAEQIDLLIDRDGETHSISMGVNN
ncbi:type II secretion system protein GspC [Thalassotalea crassostreae]|uniref:type II secretion system protein GspC n=1 Tax=Thalassotalea crassostreae TaxID=1763536 RepID=UPI00083910F0|nr:type II secretion system protein GspC [Thalassotalea crassostreae]